MSSEFTPSGVNLEDPNFVYGYLSELVTYQLAEGPFPLTIRDIQVLNTAAKLLQSEKGTPLDALMDNVLAWRLGEIANDAVKWPAGDLIDRGLTLLRLLKDREFNVTYTGKKPL